MKITADRAVLADALSWTTGVIPTRPTVHALAGVKLVADTSLHLNAFSGETGHTITLEVEIHEPGDVLVSGKFLAMVVNGMRGASVSLTLDGPNLIIASGRSTYRARTMKVDDFPPMPAIGEPVGRINAAELAVAIGVVTGPVDDDSILEHTAGLHLEANLSEDNELWVVGADESARSLHAHSTEWIDGPIDVTVPSGMLVGAVRGMEGVVELGVMGGNFTLRDARRTVTLRTYATKFMAGKWRTLYERAQAKHEVEVDRAELLAALGRANALGSEEGSIGLTFAPGEVVVEAGSDIGDGRDVIEAVCDVNASAGVGAGLLAQALIAIGSERMVLGLPGEGELKASISVTPVGDEETTRCLIMPRPRPVSIGGAA